VTMTTNDIREKLKKTFALEQGHIPPRLTTMIAAASYTAADGATILAKGDPITEDALNQLLAAGVKSIEATQDTPTEIACAQLCGLGHYRMRGTLVLDTPEEFQKWLEEEVQYLEQ